MFFENRTNGIWTSDIRHPVSLFLFIVTKLFTNIAKASFICQIQYYEFVCDFIFLRKS